ncbi:MAG: DUF1036 domain-containing protein [Alphaproteobacteria bacterium]
MPAAASFTLCNRTHQDIEASFARRDDNRWISEGWWRIAPQECQKILTPPLRQRFYYYYARAATPPQRIWGGKYRFCTDTKPYMIIGDADCSARHFGSTGFAQVDVGDRNQYTLDFNE